MSVNGTLLDDSDAVDCLSQPSLILLDRCSTDCPFKECLDGERVAECRLNATDYGQKGGSAAAAAVGVGVKDGDDDDGNRTNNWFALLLFLIVAVAIAGNILVCLAVYCKRKLQNMFNYFLVSLAMSDMLSAILVMPLSIMRAAIASLPVPMLMCIAWYSLDVLFTSSTICHLCMISIDRYMTLTYPLKYGHAKKKKHTILKIAIVWVISFCIAGPLFILSTLDTHEDTVQYKGCGPETPTFVISATVTSFYLPLLIMTVMYALTVRALQQQLREQRRMTVTNSCNRSRTSSRADSTSIFYCPSRKASAPSASLLGDLSSPQLNYSSCENQPRNPLFKQHSLQRDPAGSSLTIDEPFTQETSPASSSSTAAASASAAVQGALHLKAHSQSLKLKSTHSLTTSDHRSVHANPSGRYLMVTGSSPWGEGQIAYSLDTSGTASSKAGSEIALNDVATDFDGLGSQSNLACPRSPVDKSRFRFNRSFTLRRSVSSTGSRRGASSPDKGRRAVQVLGILFAVFVICYLPFFAVYVIKGTCLQCQPYISPHLLIALEWLAYSGSMLNPIIYHIFNPDFRRAFQNLLSCSSCSCATAAAPKSRKHELPVCRIDTV